MKKTKNELFQYLKSIQKAKFGEFYLINHKAIQEAETLRELKQNLAYYYSKYKCLGAQTGQTISGIEGGKHFLGNVYFTSNKDCKNHLIRLTAIAQFMGYEIEKLTW